MTGAKIGGEQHGQYDVRLLSNLLSVFFGHLRRKQEAGNKSESDLRWNSLQLSAVDPQITERTQVTSSAKHACFKSPGALNPHRYEENTQSHTQIPQSGLNGADPPVLPSKHAESHYWCYIMCVRYCRSASSWAAFFYL